MGLSGVWAEESNLALPATDEGLAGEGPVRRADWFERLWLERRSKWAGDLEADQGAVVFLGDSITQGWGGGLGAAFPGLKVANRGISGDTTRGILIRMKEDVLDVLPSGVVLLIGTNDLSAGGTTEQIVGNVKLILDALNEQDAEMPIVLCEVFPSSETMNRPSAKIREINAGYRKLAKGYEQVLVVDTFSLFDDGHGDAMPELFPDLLHLNEAGYARWAETLRGALREVGLLNGRWVENR